MRSLAPGAPDAYRTQLPAHQRPEHATEPALVAAKVAAALDDGQSVQAPQLRHEWKDWRRYVPVGGADQDRVELTGSNELLQRVGVLIRQDEVLQADAGRVQACRGPAQQARAHNAPMGACLRRGGERDEQRQADELAVRPLAAQRDEAMRIDGGIRGDQDSRRDGLASYRW